MNNEQTRHMLAVTALLAVVSSGFGQITVAVGFLQAIIDGQSYTGGINPLPAGWSESYSSNTYTITGSKSAGRKGYENGWSPSPYVTEGDITLVVQAFSTGVGVPEQGGT